jgi:hypothetical protein
MHALWPREHGAYAQLGIPIAAAMLLDTPTLTSSLLAVAACFAFLANEPLVILLGHRGARRRDTLHAAAARRLAVTAAAAVLAGGAGLALASSTVLAVAGVVAVPSAAMLWLSWRRSAHSLIGELVAALALPGASAPVAVASGTPWQTALQLWLAWSLGYMAGVVAVHHVIARRRGPTRTDLPRLATLAIMTLGSIALAFQFRAFALAVPLAAVSTLVAIRSPSPRQLRAIGIGLVAASVVSASLVVMFVSGTSCTW